MVITTDIDTFTKRYKDPSWTQRLMECHVCMEKIDGDKMVTCENGHSCCQKHHLERIRAIYQEGRFAFDLGPTHGGGQHCFMCRCNIEDDLFSSAYRKNLHVIQAIELPKLMRRQGNLSRLPSTQEILDGVEQEMQEMRARAKELDRLHRRRTQLGI